MALETTIKFIVIVCLHIIMSLVPTSTLKTKLAMSLDNRYSINASRNKVRFLYRNLTKQFN